MTIQRKRDFLKMILWQKMRQKTRHYTLSYPDYIVEFSKCFLPDIEKNTRIAEINTPKKWVKPQLRIWDEKDILDELITFCINNIENQWTLWIIVDNDVDIPVLYDKIMSNIRLKKNNKINYQEKIFYSNLRETWETEMLMTCENIINSNVLITTIESVDLLEFDNVIYWKIWKTNWRNYDNLSRYRYYIWMITAKKQLIICQENKWFWKYKIDNSLYEVYELDANGKNKRNDDEIKLPF